MKPETSCDNDRLRKAAKIIRNPAGYKICEGCESIVTTRAALCPSCHSYRFDARGDMVVEQAMSLSQRPRKSVLASDFE